jgi:hypothetical protein
LPLVPEARACPHAPPIWYVEAAPFAIANAQAYQTMDWLVRVRPKRMGADGLDRGRRRRGGAPRCGWPRKNPQSHKGRQAYRPRSLTPATPPGSPAGGSPEAGTQTRLAWGHAPNPRRSAKGLTPGRPPLGQAREAHEDGAMCVEARRGDLWTGVRLPPPPPKGTGGAFFPLRRFMVYGARRTVMRVQRTFPGSFLTAFRIKVGK